MFAEFTWGKLNTNVQQHQIILGQMKVIIAYIVKCITFIKAARFNHYDGEFVRQNFKRIKSSHFSCTDMPSSAFTIISKQNVNLPNSA